MQETKRSWLGSLVWNVALLAATWGLGFVLIRIGNRLPNPGVWSEAGQSVAFILGLAVAWRYRVRLAAFALAALVALSVSELVVHALWGIGSVQGAQRHFAVLGAAVLGVLLGASLSARRNDRPRTEDAPEKPLPAPARATG